MNQVALELGSWHVAEDVSEWLELAAIFVITVGGVVAITLGVLTAVRSSIRDGIRMFRARFATGLLIGLDLLIAADVIRTVTLEPTLENVAALGLVVVVRTLLSWTLVVEHEHRWPWQAPSPDDDAI